MNAGYLMLQKDSDFSNLNCAEYCGQLVCGFVCCVQTAVGCLWRTTMSDRTPVPPRTVCLITRHSNRHPAAVLLVWPPRTRHSGTLLL